jgi:hypothetical protein
MAIKIPVYRQTLAEVTNRGRPPTSFLNDLVEWARLAPVELFAPSRRRDVYWSVAQELGPWEGLPHRRAVMLEVLRVLAGFESSWNWRDGRDITNPNEDAPENEETGIFQVSADSMDLDRGLYDYIREKCGSTKPEIFIAAMKTDKHLAIEYAARLLRVTVRHNGPVSRKEINPWLSRAAVAEFQRIVG